MFGVGQAKEIGVGKSKTITASNTTHDIIIMMGNQDWRAGALSMCGQETSSLSIEPCPKMI